MNPQITHDYGFDNCPLTLSINDLTGIPATWNPTTGVVTFDTSDRLLDGQTFTITVTGTTESLVTPSIDVVFSITVISDCKVYGEVVVDVALDDNTAWFLLE